MPDVSKYVEKLWEGFPRYLLNALNGITNPKGLVQQVVAQYDTQPLQATREAITFLAYSCVVVGLIGIAVAGIVIDEVNNKFIHGVVLVFVFVTIFVALEAAALRLSWRLVGGRVPYKKVFLVDCYFFGITLLFCELTILVFIGAQRIEFPSPVMIALYSTGMLGLCVWTWFYWNAYRNLNQLSMVRSVGALVLAIGLTTIVTVIDSLLLVGFIPK